FSHGRHGRSRLAPHGSSALTATRRPPTSALAGSSWMALSTCGAATPARGLPLLSAYAPWGVFGDQIPGCRGGLAAAGPAIWRPGLRAKDQGLREGDCHA